MVALPNTIHIEAPNAAADDTPKVKMYDLIDAFANFYETFLYPYCKGNIICERIEEFDFEHVQYVMDKMKEIIYILSGQYGL